jgi:hypothetical protein
MWSPYPDLNRRPLPYQGSALPLSYMGNIILPGHSYPWTPIQLFYAYTQFSILNPAICHHIFYQHIVGAGDRDRTDIISLEGWGSTIELHPHLHLLLVEGVGFEPTKA